ncbi:hypothetical protein B0H14DRAFT_2596478 [Mycena olivaceomarginata]|nr:hypothetical protein B0H14DRAFT_2596478 [Mycena olivaceomarginata]
MSKIWNVGDQYSELKAPISTGLPVQDSIACTSICSAALPWRAGDTQSWRCRLSVFTTPTGNQKNACCQVQHMLEMGYAGICGTLIIERRVQGPDSCIRSTSLPVDILHPGDSATKFPSLHWDLCVGGPVEFTCFEISMFFESASSAGAERRHILSDNIVYVKGFCTMSELTVRRKFTLEIKNSVNKSPWNTLANHQSKDLDRGPEVYQQCNVAFQNLVYFGFVHVHPGHICGLYATHICKKHL